MTRPDPTLTPGGVTNVQIMPLAPSPWEEELVREWTKRCSVPIWPAKALGLDLDDTRSLLLSAVVKAAREWKGEGKPTRAWVATYVVQVRCWIARNGKALPGHKARLARCLDVHTPPPPAAAAGAHQRELVRVVYALQQTLPPHLFAALTLRYTEELSLDTVATALGIRPRQFTARLDDAKVRAREILATIGISSIDDVVAPQTPVYRGRPALRDQCWSLDENPGPLYAPRAAC